MPSQTIAQSLPYINWTVLITLALGSLGAAVLLREIARPSKGFLAFSGWCAAFLGLLVWIMDGDLVAPEGLAIVSASGEIDTARRVALAAFVVLSAVYGIVARGTGPAWRWGGLALGAGSIVLILAAVGWSGDLVASVPLLIQYLILAAVTGGSLAGLVLAHWYLVTPHLTERPIVLLTLGLTILFAIQIALSVVWTALGSGMTVAPFSAIPSGAMLFVILRFVVGLLFPLVLTYMAYRTTLTRSMESATGLLYIGIAAVAAGTIVASALYYTSGVLV